MPLEKRVKAEPCAGSLSACLVDGNVEQTARERKIRRRALAISVSLQTIGLTALVIAPMLAKPAELATHVMMPIPPYRPAPARPIERPSVATPGPHRWDDRILVQPPRIPDRIPPTSSDENPPEGLDKNATVAAGSGDSRTGLEIFDSRSKPTKPIDKPETPQILHVTKIDPAQLVRRVEPVYPPLAKQLHRAGKVELHALIGTDGSIQSLQVVSGEPLLVQSALDAVNQWRYRPTFLNGQPVEVDTYITVIYSLQQ